MKKIITGLIVVLIMATFNLTVFAEIQSWGASTSPAETSEQRYQMITVVGVDSLLYASAGQFKFNTTTSAVQNDGGLDVYKWNASLLEFEYWVSYNSPSSSITYGAPTKANFDLMEDDSEVIKFAQTHESAFADFEFEVYSPEVDTIYDEAPSIEYYNPDLTDITLRLYNKYSEEYFQMVLDIDESTQILSPSIYNDGINQGWNGVNRAIFTSTSEGELADITWYNDTEFTISPQTYTSPTLPQYYARWVLPTDDYKTTNNLMSGTFVFKIPYNNNVDSISNMSIQVTGFDGNTSVEDQNYNIYNGYVEGWAKVSGFSKQGENDLVVNLTWNETVYYDTVTYTLYIL